MTSEKSQRRYVIRIKSWEYFFFHQQARIHHRVTIHIVRMINSLFMANVKGDFINSNMR